MLKNKKILLGITGSIAAYKTIHIVRLLIKQGAEVKVIMTPAAKDFVSPLVLSTLSKNNVMIDMFAENTWANHVQLGRWADLILIAPLSCNSLAKMAYGQCDNLLLSVYLSATCPVIVAPAMDEDMWHHPATQNNLTALRNFGIRIIQPGNGELASGLFGEGRMEEPEQIITLLEEHFAEVQDLSGKKVLVTAGPTYEALDPVRFIGNHSSGKMGIAIARECKNRGADVTLVLGPVSLTGELNGIHVIKVTSSDEMYETCNEYFKNTDIAILAAAVADFKPEKVSDSKIKKNDAFVPEIKLVQTRDTLKKLGEIKSDTQVLVGFALETDNEKTNALEKLARKNADYIVLNSLSDGTAFGSDSNKIIIFCKDGREIPFLLKSKNEVAKDIIDTIVKNPKTAVI